MLFHSMLGDGQLSGRWMGPQLWQRQQPSFAAVLGQNLQLLSGCRKRDLLRGARCFAFALVLNGNFWGLPGRCPCGSLLQVLAVTGATQGWLTLLALARGPRTACKHCAPGKFLSPSSSAGSCRRQMFLFSLHGPRSPQRWQRSVGCHGTQPGWLGNQPRSAERGGDTQAASVNRCLVLLRRRKTCCGRMWPR